MNGLREIGGGLTEEERIKVLDYLRKITDPELLEKFEQKISETPLYLFHNSEPIAHLEIHLPVLIHFLKSRSFIKEYGHSPALELLLHSKEIFPGTWEHGLKTSPLSADAISFFVKL